MNLTRMIALASLALAACAHEPGAPENDDKEAAARQAAYEKCLHDNMAVAMAWEAIEEMCRRQSEGGEDPLGEAEQEPTR